MQDKWFERTLAALGIIGLGVLLWAGVAHAAGTVCQIPNGCTGLGTSPSYGQVLVGNSSSGYTLTATSSLGLGGGSSASSTLLSDNNTFSGHTLFTASTTMQQQLNLQGASSTLFSATTGWIGTLNLTNALAIAQGGTGLTSTSQNFFFAGPTSGSGAPTWRAIVAADIPTLNQNTSGSAATLTTARTINTVSFNGSANITITAASSTLLGDSNTFTASTTFTNVSNLAHASTSLETVGTFWNTGITSALVSVDANHKENAYGGASACSSNNFVTTISALGATTCGTASISGVNLGSNLNSLANDGATLTGTSYNGSAVVSNWAINLNHSNAWTQLQVFSLNSTSTETSAYQAFFGGTATDTISTTGSLTLQDADNAWSGLSTPTRNLTLFAATTTTWTATDTGAYTPGAIMTFSGTVKDVRCLASSTNAFLGVTPYIGSTAMTPSYFVASNTVGKISFTSNNTFTAGQELGMYVGTSTAVTANVYTRCTFEIVQTS